MHEQRVANATVASPPHDPTNARSEAPLLELPHLCVWTQEKEVSIPSLGFGIAHVRLLDTASIRPSRVDARTVNYSDSCVRQSPLVGRDSRPNCVPKKELRRYEPRSRFPKKTPFRAHFRAFYPHPAHKSSQRAEWASHCLAPGKRGWSPPSPGHCSPASRPTLPAPRSASHAVTSGVRSCADPSPLAPA